MKNKYVSPTMREIAISGKDSILVQSVGGESYSVKDHSDYSWENEDW